MYRLIIFLFSFIFLSSRLNAQETIPVEKAIKWNYSVEYLPNNEANIVITASLFHHFHLFSIKHNPDDYDGTGTPTTIVFKKNSNYSLVGKVRESKAISGTDDYGSYVWHDKKAIFTQRIKINSKSKFDIGFSVGWQICDPTMCHMPKEDNLVLAINSGSGKGVVSTALEEIDLQEVTSSEKATQIEESIGTCELPSELEKLPISFGTRVYKKGENQFEVRFLIKGLDTWKITSGEKSLFKNVKFMFSNPSEFKQVGSIKYPKTKSYFDTTYKNNISYYPIGSEFVMTVFSKDGTLPVLNGTIEFSALSDRAYFVTEELNFRADLAKATSSVEELESSKTYLGIFFIAFLAGFAALLTPCVFPMIPMTVSYFLKQSKSRKVGVRNALIYSLSIIVIYVTLGLGVTLIFGEQALNAMSTNVYFNLFFFLLLLIFGASFLGAFEIRMPSSWVNKTDAQADKGGLLGIFFMAFTLALVSFSCTGPIIGTLLVEATSKGIMGPLFGMLGFSLALALPFGLFSAFPAWLNTMPQSGGWLNSVKVVLGFLEIALAFKFLSNADLVVQAHLLEREVFLAFWVVIFALIGFYLIGKLKFSHDSELPFISVTRIFISIVVFSFVVYMIPGLWGAPVKILSGFLPPQHYSEVPYGIGGQAPEKKLPKHAYHGPHGIPVFHDYDDALAYAREIGKPLMLDFTGHACINCRKMEDQVWSNDLIKKMLTDSVVVVSLHVDEKLTLPVNKQIKDDKGNWLKTVGDKWSYLQRSRYGQQTQPQYVLLDGNEEKLMPSTTYTSSSNRIEEFKKWLDDGIAEYNVRKKMILIEGSALIKPKKCVLPANAPTYPQMYFELYKESL